MKKNRLKKITYQTKNSDKCPDKLSTDGVYPPLFCNHTWTKCVPISVNYLLTIINTKNFMHSHTNFMILNIL